MKSFNLIALAYQVSESRLVASTNSPETIVSPPFINCLSASFSIMMIAINQLISFRNYFNCTLHCDYNNNNNGRTGKRKWITIVP